MADKPTPDELKRRYEEHREKAIASFPFERIETAGDQGLETWESLSTSGRGAPVVVGDYDALTRTAEMMPDLPGLTRKSTHEILEISSRIRHPDDLISQHAKDMAQARERLPEFFQRKPDLPLPDFIQAAGWSGGSANWRLRSRRRATDRIRSEECLSLSPTAN